MNEPPANGVLCIGAAHVDRTARCLGEFVRGGSNPVTTRDSGGGVAHNVALNLVRLGRPVALATALGADTEGERLTEALSRDGIDISAVLRALDYRTASYTAILDRAGELIAGFSDAAIYEAMNPAVVAEVGDRFAAWPVWLVDANLPVESLSRVAPRGRLFACAVSPAKAERLRPCLGRVEALFANRAEAAVLSGRAVGCVEDALAAAHALREAGPGMAFVTLGAEGVAVAAPGVSATWPALPSAVRDVNGAGDAFAAGVIDGLIGGAPVDLAVGRGLAMASITAECDGAVAPTLDIEALAQRAGRAGPRA